MARTKGAKGNPKDPQNELARVKKMFADQKIPFPGDKEPELAKDQQTGDQQDTTFSLGDQLKGDFKCGNCQAQLDDEYPVCPKCGVSLTWT